MKKNLNTKAGLRRFSFRLFLFLLIISVQSVQPQIKTNLDIFFSQVDTLSNEILSHISGTNDEIKLNFRSGSDYSILENRLLSLLIKKGAKLNSTNNSAVQIDLAFSEAKVTYSDSYRDGLFGDLLVVRGIELQGNFIIQNANFSKDFSFNYSDTVKYEDLKELENRAYPFTQNNHPAEPFLSSLIEPVIAIGAAATAVILFFTIRSK